MKFLIDITKKNLIQEIRLNLLLLAGQQIGEKDLRFINILMKTLIFKSMK